MSVNHTASVKLKQRNNSEITHFLCLETPYPKLTLCSFISVSQASLHAILVSSALRENIGLK